MVPTDKRAESKTAKSICTTRKRAEHATSTSASGEWTVKKQEAEEGQTVAFATSHRPQGTPLESESLALPKVTSSGRSRVYLSLDQVSNIEEFFFGKKFEIVLFTAKTYKIESTIEITCKIQVHICPFLKLAQAQSLSRN